MSTENNLDKTFNSSVKILSDLIAFKSISGEDNNSIINYENISTYNCKERRKRD